MRKRSPIGFFVVHFLRVSLAATCLLTETNGAPPSPKPASTGADEVSMPPLLVLHEQANRVWSYLEFPGGELLSAYPPDEAREFALDYFNQLTLLALLVPQELRPPDSVPEMIVLFDRSQARPLSNELERLAENQPSPAPSSEATIQNFGERRTARFLPNFLITGKDVSAICAEMSNWRFNRTFQPGSSVQLTPQNIRWRLERRRPALPAWYVEGVLELMKRVTFRSDRVSISPERWTPKTWELLTARIAPDKPPRLRLGLQEIFSASPTQLASDPIAVARWRIQSMLFIRWCLERAEPDRFGALTRFVIAGGQSEDDFEKCFGKKFSATDDSLNLALQREFTKSLVLKRGAKPPEPQIEAASATPLQISRIMAEWRLLTSLSPSTPPPHRQRYGEEALRATKHLKIKDELDPRLQGVMGLIELSLGNKSEARRHLEASYKAGALRPGVCVELARLRLGEVRLSSKNSGRLLTAGEVHTVLDPLFAARKLQPSLPETYRLIAETWTLSEVMPSREHLSALDEGLERFPTNSSLILAAAEAFDRSDFKREARTLAEAGMRFVHDPTELAILQRILAANAP